MKDGCLKLFNIYPGEQRKVFTMLLLTFLLAVGSTSGYKMGDALFLLHCGSDSLPTAYALTALADIIAALFLLRAYERTSPHRIFSVLLIIGVSGYCAVSALIHSHIAFTSHVWIFAIKVFATGFHVLIMSAFWMFVDQYHHLQHAKRIYALFNSSLFVGTAATGAILGSSLFAFNRLAALVAMMLLSTFIWAQRIHQTVTPVLDEGGGEEARSSSGFFAFLKEIACSRYSVYLILSYLVLELTLFTTEFHYLNVVESCFSDSLVVGKEASANLTRFLGRATFSIAFINLLTGWFIYSRLAKRMGVTRLVFVTPSILLACYLGWPFCDGLMIPMIAMFVVDGTDLSIDDNNFNLLINAVPSKLRGRVRVFLETFCEPLGMLACGLFLAAGGQTMLLLGLTLTLILYAIAFKLRTGYLHSLQSILSSRSVDFSKSSQETLKCLGKENIATLSKQLEGADLFDMASEAVIISQNQELIKKMMNRASPPSAALLERLRESSIATDPIVVEVLQNVVSSDPGAAFYLAEQGLLSAENAERALEHEDPIMQAAGMIHFKHPIPKDAPPKLALRMMGAIDPIQYIGELFSYLSRPESSLFYEGLFVISRSEELSSFLSSPHVFAKVLEAATRCPFSERRKVERLLAQFKDPLRTYIEKASHSLRGRLLAARLLKQSGAHRGLTPLIGREIEDALGTFYQTHTLQQQHPNADLQIVTQSLQANYQRRVDLIFQLLGAAGYIDNADILYQALRSNNGKVQAQAIETIEKVCPRSLSERLAPMISDMPLQEALRELSKAGHTTKPLETLLPSLSGSTAIVHRLTQHFRHPQHSLRQA